MIYPTFGAEAPPASPDMPDAVAELYAEARQVTPVSPRAGAAMLRVALEILVRELTGKPKQSLYEGIGELVKDGTLNADMQRAADLLRLGGNNAAHPGELRQDDGPAQAFSLFELMNMIVEHVVAKRRRISAMFDRLEPSQLEAIERRDTPPDGP
ncbi:hypothetical protein FHX74_003204 [Friedmanniella endophytica]|uniref:DUF4145 domain-containing protein n=1 Tax=Microlunatus kandeliicorticis TaxID=1759536 RepID=A0A7W3P723_9ACTN|nr:DUF4145 domain-containing protein [Microlunatus kandeliicorticis]MBA8795568.1 hypothetical protein [Microlunatus kandeliicorticis]